MDNLAAYSDSDDETSPLSKRHSSKSHPPTAMDFASVTKPKFDFDEDELWPDDEMDEKKTKENFQLPPIERRQRRRDTEIPEAPTTPSDHFWSLTEKDDSVHLEPPPPKRKYLVYSPSPSTSTLSSPVQCAKMTMVVSKMTEDENETQELGPNKADQEQQQEDDEDATLASPDRLCRPSSDRDTPYSDSPQSTPFCPLASCPSLPPVPSASCDLQLERHFALRFQMKALGEDVNRKIQERKDFKNPSIYEMLIGHFEIDELGSNFSPSVFDPHGFPADCYYDKLAETQKVAMDKLDKEKKKSKGKEVEQDTRGHKKRSRFDECRKARVES